MAKKYNFYAGPAILPYEVMKKAQEELLDYNGIGLSVMEISHRSKDFDAVITGAVNKVKSALNVPDNYSIACCRCLFNHPAIVTISIAHRECFSLPLDWCI